jgi:hypothetical protein
MTPAATFLSSSLSASSTSSRSSPPAVRSRALRRAGQLAVGTVLGVVLSRVGFTRYDELHAMLTLADPRLIAAFAGAVVVSAIGYRLVGERATPGRVSPQLVTGGVLFGLGWAVAGACPGVAFAQLGEGKLWSLVTLAGLVAGTRLGARVRNQLANGR